jgi:glycosyltransferase involved in cell wall biosynthesis
VKVLILHQHFNTPEKGGAIRSYYLAKALVEAKIHTVVITGHNEKLYKRVEVEGIEVHYLPIAYENRFGFFDRSISFIKFVLGCVRMAGKIPDVKVCYAISAPLTVGIAAMRIKKRFKIPFIFEVGDLWPDAPIQLGFVNNFFFKKILYHLEKSIYNEAQSVVALSPAIQSAIEKKVSGKRTHLIPNMADCDFFAPALKDPVLESKYGVSGKLVISYIGAIGVANGLDYFLECANASRKANLPIHFLLCGEGALLDRLKRNVTSMNLTNFSFISFQNRQGVHEVMNVTDAAFICYKNVPILETGSPNKFFDGLAAGKLIIVNFGGWIKREIEEAHCGIYVDPLNPTDFVKKISVFVSDKKKLSSYQESSRQLGERKYSRKILAKRFQELF